MEDSCNITYRETSRVSRNVPYCLFATTHQKGIFLKLNSAFRGENLVPKDLTYGTE
jgi:hypothetical protein